MSHDQADHLRELVRRRFATASNGPLAKLIVVAGGKGGVGTSTIAANLATALAAQGRRTVLVEADLNRAAGGIAARSESGSIVDALCGRRTVHEILERGPGGIQVVPGVWAPSDIVECSPAAQERFVVDLRNLGRHAEAAIIDVGSGRDLVQRRFWQMADMVLVVTTPEPASIIDSYAAIKVLRSDDPAVPLYTLANMAGEDQAADVHARIGDACRRFLGRQVFAAGCVLPDASESSGANSALGLRMFQVQSPRSEAARAIEVVAEKVWLAVAAQSGEPQSSQAFGALERAREDAQRGKAA